MFSSKRDVEPAVSVRTPAVSVPGLSPADSVPPLPIVTAPLAVPVPPSVPVPDTLTVPPSTPFTRSSPADTVVEPAKPLLSPLRIVAPLPACRTPPAPDRTPL